MLIGGGGNDILEGLRGSDVYRIDDMGDIVLEDSGAASDVDQVYVAMTSAAHPQRWGAGRGAGRDRSRLDHGFNLNGNDYHNTIFGTAGVNVLIGGGGWDTLAGGAGNDIYRVEKPTTM